MSPQDIQPDPAPDAVSLSELRDQRLIAEGNAPPSVEEAQEMLAFWEKRLAGLHVYELTKKNEATEMVARSRQRLREAERSKYGPSALEQLLQAVGIRNLPGHQLIRIAKRGLIVVAVLLVVLVIAVIAFWSDIEPVLRTLIELGGNSQGGG